MIDASTSASSADRNGMSCARASQAAASAFSIAACARRSTSRSDSLRV